MRRLALGALLVVMLVIDLSAIVGVAHMWTLHAPSEKAFVLVLPLRLLAIATAGGFVWLTVVVGKATIRGHDAPSNDGHGFRA